MQNEITLDDLNIVYHSEIDFDGLIIPLKIDVKDITEYDYIMAVSVMNEYKKKAIPPQHKEKSELEDLKTVEILEDKFVLSYKKLEYAEEINFLENQSKMNFAFKFINTEDKLFENNTETLLEYLQYENMEEWFNDHGMTDIFYTKLYKMVAYWVDIAIMELQLNTKIALLLNDKKGKEINYNLSKLKGCYETMGVWYFEENENIRAFSKLSYREQHLHQSYHTKMYYIESAINEDTKKQFEEAKGKSNTNRRSSSRSKY